MLKRQGKNQKEQIEQKCVCEIVIFPLHLTVDGAFCLYLKSFDRSGSPHSRKTMKVRSLKDGRAAPYPGGCDQGFPRSLWVRQDLVGILFAA